MGADLSGLAFILKHQVFELFCGWGMVCTVLLSPSDEVNITNTHLKSCPLCLMFLINDCTKITKYVGQGFPSIMVINFRIVKTPTQSVLTLIRFSLQLIV